MRGRIKFLAIFLGGVSVLAGGASAHPLHQRQQVRVPVSATEAHWRARVQYMAAGNPLVSLRAAAAIRHRLLTTIGASGAKAVRVIVRRAIEPAPEIVIAVAEPANYLKFKLKSVLQITRPDRNVYLSVVDTAGRRILEWAINGDKTPNSGSLYVKHGFEACSPIVAIGWPSKLPPCPAH